MATQAQILANRSNAQKSTGPRTAEGKGAVAKNAVKHGLCGQETVVTGEDPGEFEFYRERMLGELDPAGEVEAGLAERIVSLSWRLQRAEKLQAAAFDSLYAKQKDSLSEKLDKSQDADGDSTLGRAIVRDFANNRVLDRLLMYERRIEHSLYRTMAELKRHRLLQEVGPGGMWELRRALARDDATSKESAVRGRATCEEPPAEGPANALERGLSGDVPGARAKAGCAAAVCTAAERGNQGRDAHATKTLPASPFTLHELSCKTKPIQPSPDHGQVPCREELTEDLSSSEPGETKPISGVVLLQDAVVPGAYAREDSSGEHIEGQSTLSDGRIAAGLTGLLSQATILPHQGPAESPVRDMPATSIGGNGCPNMPCRELAAGTFLPYRLDGEHVIS